MRLLEIQIKLFETTPLVKFIFFEQKLQLFLKYKIRVKKCKFRINYKFYKNQNFYKFLLFLFSF